MRRQKDAYGSPKRFGSMTLSKLQRAQSGPPLGLSLVIEACSDYSSRNLKGRSRYLAPLEPYKQIQQLCHVRDLFRRQHDRVLLNLCDIIQRRCYIKKKKFYILYNDCQRRCCCCPRLQAPLLYHWKSTSSNFLLFPCRACTNILGS